MGGMIYHLGNAWRKRRGGSGGSSPCSGNSSEGKYIVEVGTVGGTAQEFRVNRLEDVHDCKASIPGATWAKVYMEGRDGIEKVGEY